MSIKIIPKGTKFKLLTTGITLTLAIDTPESSKEFPLYCENYFRLAMYNHAQVSRL